MDGQWKAHDEGQIPIRKFNIFVHKNKEKKWAETRNVYKLYTQKVYISYATLQVSGIHRFTSTMVVCCYISIHNPSLRPVTETLLSGTCNILIYNGLKKSSRAVAALARGL